MTQNKKQKQNDTKSTSIAQDKKIVKNTKNPTTVTSQKFKWEQQHFVEALKDKKWNLAISIMETTLKDAEAKRNWWNNPEAKPYYYEYIQWLRDCRQQAGATDWKMWDKVIEENRLVMGVERLGEKKDTSVNVGITFNSGNRTGKFVESEEV